MFTFPLYKLNTTVIDNAVDYLCLKNGSIKFGVGPYQFNLRFHHLLQFAFNVKKDFQKFAVCDRLAKWLIMLGFMTLRCLSSCCGGKYLSKSH